jgi:hypothetical protein
MALSDRLQQTETQLLRLSSKDAQTPLEREVRHAVVNALTLVMAYRKLLEDETQPEDDLIADADAALRRAEELTHSLGPA